MRQQILLALSRIRARWANSMATVNPAPILVLGNQKTGTTVIAALLAHATSQSVTLDTPGIFEPNLSRLVEGTVPFNKFVQRNALDFSRDIVKEPNFTFFYEQLKQQFPRARFIFVQRDPRDNIRSILNRLGIPGHLARMDRTVAMQIPEAWRSTLTGQLLGHAGKNYVEVLAHRWNHCTDTYLKAEEPIALVQYEHFVHNKITAIVQLAKALGLSARPELIRNQLNVQYQHKGDNNANWSTFFGAENLSAIESICGEKMQLFGYKRQTP